MIKILALIFLLLGFSCHSGNSTKVNSNPLAGTWRLTGYADFDAVLKKWTYPYGEHPKGYFTYTSNGIVNLSVSAEYPLNIAADAAYKKPITLGMLLDNAVSYFGTYSIDHKNATVTHYPQGGSIPWYIGTQQQRQFLVKGDTLFIGDPVFSVGKRVLVREE